MTSNSDPAETGLPARFTAALARGALNKCPRCGGAPLFTRWLKPVDHCSACGTDWRHQRADDFPAYVAILVTGHVLAPVMIWLVMETALSPAALGAILLTTATAMLLAMLQPAKGAIIAMQWWHGMHGFRRERRPEPAAERHSRR